jgi:hypothetical protein
MILVFVVLAACGGRSTRDQSQAGGSGGSGARPGVGSGATAGELVTNSTGIDGLGCPGVPITDDAYASAAETVCAIAHVECGAAWPHDLHLLVERSERMRETIDGVSKWELTRRALKQFLAPSSFQRVSLRLFGADGGNDCDPATYTQPLVPPGDDEATVAAILAAMDTHAPGGLAPTVPALAGTLAEVQRIQNTTRDGQRVVLILGGAPTDCAGTPGSLRAAFAASPVTSYVVALAPDFDVGPVGEATETWPFLVEAGDSETRLADALRHITRGASRQACDFGRALPNRVTVDPARTRVFFGDDEVPQLSSAAECASSDYGGFYLTEGAEEPEYQSCPCTCARYTTCEGAEWLFYCP